MAKTLINMIALSVITLASCTSTKDNQTEVTTTNPFLSEYTTPFHVPPFDQIKHEHYLPAFGYERTIGRSGRHRQQP